MPPRRVFIALPTYNGLMVTDAFHGLMFATKTAERFTIQVWQGSLLGLVFNRLWVGCLNSRNQFGWTHFAMHHADIGAPENWLDTLMDELDATGADIMAAAVPIKDGRGLLSGGILRRDGSVRRLTMAELFQLPPTFVAEDVEALLGKEADKCDLVLNTGLWVCRMDAPWVEDACFTVRDAITRNKEGEFQAKVLPEDWAFSAWAAERGLKLACTRKIPLRHHGGNAFVCEPDFGSWTMDHGDSYTGKGDR